MAPAEQMLRIQCLVTRALAHQIVHELIADGNIVLPAELFLDVIHCRILRRIAGQLRRKLAMRPVGVDFQE